MTKAVGNVNGDIAAALVGARATEQGAIDRTLIDLDGTPNKSRLGANAILGVSLAVARAAADEAQEPLYRFLGGADANVLPVPMMNVRQRRRPRRQLGRPPGVHGHADRRPLVHRGDAGGHRGLPRAEADAGRARPRHRPSATRAGFAPDLDSNEQALEMLVAGIEAAGYRPGEDVNIALDPATSELFETAPTSSSTRDARSNSEEMVDFWVGVCDRYPGGLDRGRHGRGGLGRLGGPDRAARRERASWWATTSS